MKVPVDFVLAEQSPVATIRRLMPMIRSIVREAEENDYRFSSLVLGIVQSPAFQMRTAGAGSDLAGIVYP